MKIRLSILSLILASCLLCSCAAPQETSLRSSEPTLPPTEMPLASPTPSLKPTLPPLSDVRIESYQMEKYVEGQVSI